MNNIPELLAPAGNAERFYTALQFGADAVYLGMQRMSLRNFADNFSMDELAQACAYAHSLDRRVYVTMNAFLHDADFRGLPAFLIDIAQAGADALIVNDPGMLFVVRETLPDMELHLSTQANTLNSKTAAFWHMQGVSRIVLARELSLLEVRSIVEQAPPGLELEMFVHGAMCVSYSGRCLLSNYINGRDSNRGECAQPCRWTYEIRESGTDGAHFPIEQDARGTYILNSRDLNLMDHLQDVCATGIKSIKIEGRMKSIYYVASVVNAYRMALDAIKRGEDYPRDTLQRELCKVSHRPYSTGFAFGDPGSAGQETQSGGYLQTHTLCARVLDYAQGHALLEQRNRFCEGDEMEVLLPGDISRTVTIINLRTEENEPLLCAPHPKQRVLIDCDIPLRAGALLRTQL